MVLNVEDLDNFAHRNQDNYQNLKGEVICTRNYYPPIVFLVYRFSRKPCENLPDFHINLFVPHGCTLVSFRSQKHVKCHLVHLLRSTNITVIELCGIACRNDIPSVQMTALSSQLSYLGQLVELR